MKGRFFLYLKYAAVPVGAPSHEWEGKEYADFGSASDAAKEKVENGADEAKIFQLCGTARRDIVIS